MIGDLSSRLNNMPLFVSDELVHYASILKEQYSSTVPSPPTGKPGRPKKARLVIDPNLLYATVHKTRVNGVVTKIEKRVVYGTIEEITKKLDVSPSNTINTSYIERSNANWRLWDARLTRKCFTFAKSLQYLEAKLAKSIMFYNFIKPHGTLSKTAGKAAGQRRIPTTPAMAAGLTSSPMTQKCRANELKRISTKRRHHRIVVNGTYYSDDLALSGFQLMRSVYIAVFFVETTNCWALS